MLPDAAIACDILILIGMYWWYRHLIHIYNRFKLNDNEQWEEGAQENFEKAVNIMHADYVENENPEENEEHQLS